MKGTFNVNVVDQDIAQELVKQGYVPVHGDVRAAVSTSILSVETDKALGDLLRLLIIAIKAYAAKKLGLPASLFGL